MGRAEVIAERGSEGTTWVGRWARRSVSISLFFSLWALCWASFPLLLVLALVLDGIRRRRLATTRTLLFFALFLGCEVAGIVASFGLWIWRLGCDHERYLRANFDLQRWWASTLRLASPR